MSANRNLYVSKKRFYYADPERKLPRVEIIVEGRTFVFTCTDDLRPVVVTKPTSAHEQIKRTAHAHAAIMFKEHMKEVRPTPQPLIQKQYPLF